MATSRQYAILEMAMGKTSVPPATCAGNATSLFLLFLAVFIFTPKSTDALSHQSLARPASHSAVAVEQRTDSHGGTGLYAKHTVDRGTTLDSMQQEDVVFGADEASFVGSVVDKFCVGRNGFTESCSIGASLASWRLLHDDETTRKQAGIPGITAEHAATLPWDKARWQLPLLWSDEILASALQYGSQQVSQCQGGRPLNSDDVEEIREACEVAKMRVKSFKSAAARLAEELGPELKRQYGIDCSTDEISLACHQAMGLVFSRTFLHPPSGEMTMFPTIDSANHNAIPNAETKADPNNKGGVLLVARQDIQAGEEITIAYGLEEASTSLSFSGYGFVPQGMAQKSAADTALQLAAVRGQELARRQLDCDSDSKTGTDPADV